MLGGGFAGLASALALARDGHEVTLVERDPFPGGPAADAPEWPRRGIPHFLQPHAFIPRGCVELRRSFPDVYATLLDVGADEADLRAKLPGELRPGDEDLRYLGVRRPVIEWALRDAVLRSPSVTVHAGPHVTGLDVERGRVTAVRVDGVPFDAGLVVDALGRRTPVPGWTGAGEGVSTDCGVVYYSRYFRRRPGFEPPDGPWLHSPRGDLGYFGFATFPGDNDTFSVLLAVPPGVAEWRPLKDEPAWEAAVARIPVLASWVDPDGVDPITGVMAMAGLRNSLRDWDTAAPAGLVPVGDALGHTDPVLAHGLAFGLVHAAALVAALREHADVADAAAAYAADVRPALRERYDLASALDEQRLRLWSGGSVDVTSPDGDYELFTV
ncbi:MAG: hypothetical protein QOJ98_2850, partial [Acidobacteriota bacterium]|nr:hypothetical protein [Acidobacteriota bacterium]